MATVTEFFNSHMVPRITIGKSDNTPDGYAYGQEVSVGTDGYVFELRQNTVYQLSCRAQDIYYGMLSSDNDRDQFGKAISEMDDTEKLALLNTAGNVNGHFLDDAVTATTGGVQIATTRVCKTLVVKSATGTATVNLSPLGSFVDDLGGR